MFDPSVSCIANYLFYASATHIKSLAQALDEVSAEKLAFIDNPLLGDRLGRRKLVLKAQPLLRYCHMQICDYRPLSVN